MKKQKKETEKVCKKGNKEKSVKKQKNYKTISDKLL